MMAKKEPEKWITVNGVHIPIYEGESEKEAIKRVTKKQTNTSKQVNQKPTSEDNKKVPKSNGQEVEELNKQNKDGSITMTYVHIKNNTQKINGMDFGQDIEPAGEYMSMDTLQGRNKIDQPNYEYGTIHFKKPLVLEYKSTDSKGWKKDLSDMYGGKKKKALSNAIMKDGYDAVMTWEMYKGKKEWVEIVNLKGEKRKR